LRTQPLKIVILCDDTDRGVKIISGSSMHDVGGAAIARLGDTVSCPQFYPGGKPHGIDKIVTAHKAVTVVGIPVAVDGCKTECDCILIGKGNATLD
jgi:uncharacterized Zn-binding protein involved in type VI secretion